MLEPRDKALAFLARALDPTHALSVIEHGQVLGVAGFKTSDGSLVGGSYQDLAAVYGWSSSVWRMGLLAMLEREIKEGELLMDGIFVDPDGRGRGVGSALLDAVADEARERGLSTVRLDVVGGNPRAKALYLRRGFVVVNSEELDPISRRLFGFASYETMELGTDNRGDR